MSDRPGDRLDEIKAAHATVMPGHNYTREHFPARSSVNASFVGHTPAKVHDAALDVVLAGVPWLVAEVERLRSEGSLWSDMNHAIADEHERAEALRGALEALVDATDAVLDNYHYEHRQGCGGVPGTPPGDSDYCSVCDATTALAAAVALLAAASGGTEHE